MGDGLCLPGKGRNGNQTTGIEDRRDHGKDDRYDDGGNLCPDEKRGHKADPGGTDHIKDGRKDKEYDLPFERRPIQLCGHQPQDKQIHRGDGHIGDKLAQQELPAFHGGCVDIVDRPTLLLPHHAQGREEGGRQHHDDHDELGRHGPDALHALIVKIAHRQFHGLDDPPGPFMGYPSGPCQIFRKQLPAHGCADGRHVSLGGLGSEGKGSVNERLHMGGPAHEKILLEMLRDNDGSTDFIVREEHFERMIVMGVAFKIKVTGVDETIGILPAHPAAVLIHDHKGNILHIKRNPIA